MIGRFLGPALLLMASAAPGQELPAYPPAAEVKQQFLKQLDRPTVPPQVRSEGPTEVVGDPAATLEHLSFASERKPGGSIERVPVLVMAPLARDRAVRRPAVLVLHGTGGNKESTTGWLKDLNRRGIIGVAIDARYHGDRSGGAKGADAYNAAIARAWRAKSGEPQEHPFYFDTCWDIWRTLDYLQTRDDVDPARLGVIGISMGGIQTWLAAAADDRVKLAVPAIAVQSFRWSLENGRWQGRANTIRAAHEAAAGDLGKSQVDAEVCRALWDKVIPGVLGPFDCPSMLRLFAGRALYIANGDEDPNCPVDGAKLAIASARAAFKEAGADAKLRVSIAQGVGHKVTDEQTKAILDFCVEQLRP